MSKDSVGDFLTIIRNGIMASLPFVEAGYSRMRLSLVEILKNEGFIRDFEVSGEGARKKVKVLLKYVDGESVIHEITRISTPGRRMYAGVNEFEPVIGGLGLSILTTSRGVITNKQAQAMVIGGEIICTVW